MANPRIRPLTKAIAVVAVVAGILCAGWVAGLGMLVASTVGLMGG